MVGIERCVLCFPRELSHGFRKFKATLPLPEPTRFYSFTARLLKNSLKVADRKERWTTSAQLDSTKAAPELSDARPASGCWTLDLARTLARPSANSRSDRPCLILKRKEAPGPSLASRYDRRPTWFAEIGLYDEPE